MSLSEADISANWTQIAANEAAIENATQTLNQQRTILSQKRQEEIAIVALIRGSRLIGPLLDNEDELWQQVAELRIDQATIRTTLNTLRTQIRGWEADNEERKQLLQDNALEGVALPTFPDLPAGTLALPPLYVAGRLDVGGDLSVEEEVAVVETVDVSGAVRFGSTLDVSGAAFLASSLDVSGASTFAGTVTLPGGAQWSASAAAAGAFYSGTADPTAETRLNYDGTLHVSNLRATGNVTAFYTGTQSDARLKDRIVDMREELDARAAVAAVRPVAYTDRAGRRRIGLVAQELRAVVPHVVSEDPATGLLSVAYGDLVALLAEALGQLRADSEAEIAKLRGDLDLLRAKIEAHEARSA